MSESDLRLQQLQQIPVFALRKMLLALLDDEQAGPVVRRRFWTVLGRRPRDPARMVQRLNREQITTLINACPEIGDGQIRHLFEEYRYGPNPSFYIHVFGAVALDPAALAGFRERLEQALRAVGARAAPGLPRWRGLALDDLVSLPGRPEVSEGKYHFLSRLDYVDQDQNAISTYQTVYGFFWLNAAEGYAIIQASNPEVLKALRGAIEKGSAINLSPLVITKQLKDVLPFLFKKDLRSGRLHDPAPGNLTFRWLTVADDNLADEKYETLERQYPEVRSMRYREVVEEDEGLFPAKETSLTIRCDQGAFSLAGAIPASQFRAWCLDHLGQLIGVLRAQRSDAALFLASLNLRDRLKTNRFKPGQMPLVLKLIEALLTAKYGSRTRTGIQPVDVPALDLAAGLGDYVRVQVPYQCPEPGCDVEDYVRCPDCDNFQLLARRQDGAWAFYCPVHKKKPLLVGILPIEFACTAGHPNVLDAGDVACTVELLAGPDMVKAVADLVNSLPGCAFSPAQEAFLVRGDNLLYYPERAKAPPTEILYQTNIDGDVHGDVLSGHFQGPVAVGGGDAIEIQVPVLPA